MHFKNFILFAALATVSLAAADAVILLRTDDPVANTKEPRGDLAGSGWQYEARWGGFLGTPIAPQFFISAKHVGNAGGGVLTYRGVNYSAVQQFNDPYSDLTLWRIAETFPSFAPLYKGNTELGARIVVIGRGTQRGSQVFANNMAGGWGWGSYDSVQRWGENLVSEIVSSGPMNQFLYETFDQRAKNQINFTNEAHLSSGDSGGAVFIQDNGFWKLAGINYAVDGHFYTGPSGGGEFDAALFDARGFYYKEGANYVLLDGPKPIPTGFYATRVSSKLDWIFSVTDSRGDADANGVSNLLQYARLLNSAAGAGEPVVTNSSGVATLTYRKIVTVDLVYRIEQSSDNVSWTSANWQEQVVETKETVQTINASVSNQTSEPLYLRLLISNQ